jgi:hypothetical protein
VPDLDSPTRTSVGRAETDTIHRRTPLPYAIQVSAGDFALTVRTNFAGIKGALEERACDPGLVAAQWEIEVAPRADGATRCQALAGPPELEFFAFGPSRALRLSDGSWFAHTPPSMNGAGFAWVAGDEAEQTRQVARYMRAVLKFVRNLQHCRRAERFMEVA